MENIIITIDPKQNRIRFYRTFLKELGNPKYVQLMVNSKDKILAIKFKFWLYLILCYTVTVVAILT